MKLDIMKNMLVRSLRQINQGKKNDLNIQDSQNQNVLIAKEM